MNHVHRRTRQRLSPALRCRFSFLNLTLVPKRGAEALGGDGHPRGLPLLLLPRMIAAQFNIVRATTTHER